MMTAAWLAAALAAGSANGPPLKAPEIQCDRPDVRKVASPPGRMRKLTELPPARMELAVDRRVGQCQIPVIVVRDVEQGRTAPVRREGAPSRRR